MSHGGQPSAANRNRMPVDLVNWREEGPLIAFRGAPMTIDGNIVIAEDVVRPRIDANGKITNYFVGRQYAKGTVSRLDSTPTLEHALKMASNDRDRSGRYQDSHRRFSFEVSWGRRSGNLVVNTGDAARKFAVYSWVEAVAILRKEFMIEM